MKPIKILLIASTLVLAHTALTAMAAEERDFSRYSNEELVQMRGQAREMSETERALFRAEMQQRARALSPEERTAQGFGRRGGGQARAEGDNQRERGQGRASSENRGHKAHGRYGQGHESRRQSGPRDGSGSRRNRG